MAQGMGSWKWAQELELDSDGLGTWFCLNGMHVSALCGGSLQGSVSDEGDVSYA